MNKKRKFSLGSALLNAPYFAWAALFIIIPLAVVLFYAFSDGEGHFTFSNILSLKDYGGVILRSLLY